MSKSAKKRTVTLSAKPIPAAKPAQQAAGDAKAQKDNSGSKQSRVEGGDLESGPIAREGSTATASLRQADRPAAATGAPSRPTRTSRTMELGRWEPTMMRAAGASYRVCFDNTPSQPN